MRTVLRYEHGRAIWSENTPGRGRVTSGGFHIGGGVVTGQASTSSPDLPRSGRIQRAYRARKKALRGAALAPGVEL